MKILYKMSYVFPTSKITKKVLFISIPIVLIGITFGLLWLHSIWGGPLQNIDLFKMLHPSVMMFTFLTLFIMGVSYTLVPTFWGYKSDPLYAFTTIALLLLGEVMAIIFHVSQLNAVLGVLVSSIGLLAYAIYIITKVRLVNQVFYYSDLFILISLITLIFISFYRIYLSVLNGSPYILGDYLYDHLIISGFILPFIYGVSTRTMKFKFTYIDRDILGVSFYIYLIGNTYGIINLFFRIYEGLNILPLLYTLSAIFYGYSYNIFELSPGEEYARRMKIRDWIRYKFFTRHISIAGMWLYLGYILLIIYVFYGSIGSSTSLLLWDASLHSITIGFIGNFIVAYGGIMLPPIILRRASYKSLGYHTYLLLNTALILRVAIDIFPIPRHPILSMIHYILILLAIGSFIYMMRNLFIEESK